jgi:hypothetical protein
VLIIDEIQHLSNCKGVEKSTLLSYLVTLQNSIGIPIILVSTPKGYQFSNLSSVRLEEAAAKEILVG